MVNVRNGPVWDRRKAVTPDARPTAGAILRLCAPTRPGPAHANPSEGLFANGFCHGLLSPLVRQLTLVKARTLVWRDVPEPRLETADDVLVRPFAVARCDLDVGLLSGRLARAFSLGRLFGRLDPLAHAAFGARPYALPLPFGHECVAEVLACGDEVRSVRPGDRVTVPFQVSCGTCGRCAVGLTGQCSGVPLFSMYGGIGGRDEWGGMLADVVRVPYGDAMLVRLPDGVDPIGLASLSDNVPDAWRLVGPALGSRPRASVLVVSGFARSIGLYAAAAAVALGATRVDYLDRDRRRLDLAARVGAVAVEGTYTSFRGEYDVVADASATVAGLQCALRAVAPGGVCTVAGFFPRKSTAIPMFTLYAKKLTLATGVIDARTFIPEVLRLVETGAFDPGALTTTLASWDDAPQAMLEDSVKVVVHRPPLRSLALASGDLEHGGNAR